MKQLTTLVLLLFTMVTFSQKKFEGKATYMSKRTIDMSRFDKHIHLVLINLNHHSKKTYLLMLLVLQDQVGVEAMAKALYIKTSNQKK
jgi:hypothetical protein